MGNWNDGTADGRLGSVLEDEIYDSAVAAANAYTDAAVSGVSGGSTQTTRGSRSAGFMDLRRSVRDRPGTPGLLAAAMARDVTPRFIYPLGIADVGGTTAYDALGTAHGTYTGSTFQKGLPTPLDGGAARGITTGTGGTSYIQSPSVTGVGSTVTLEGWVRLRDHQGNFLICAGNGGDTSRPQLRLVPGTGGFVIQLFISSPTSTVAVASSVTLTDRYQWHHIVGTIGGNSSTAKIYLDGVDVTGTPTADLTIGASVTAWQSGVNFNSSGVCFSHVALYAATLTQKQVLDRYRAAALDYRSASISLGAHSDLSRAGTTEVKTDMVNGDVAAGVRNSRMVMDWRAVEGTEGVFDWSHQDEAVNLMVAAGITPVVNVVAAPQWLTGNADRYVVPGSASMEDYATAYADFMTTVVNRYKDRVRYWEIGNEQNETAFWKPTPDADDYKTLWDAVYPAIKAADPGAVVAVGGITGLTASSGVVGLTFIESLLTAGIEMDAIAIHPYTDVASSAHTNFDQSFDDAIRVAELLWANGYEDTDIWFTEFGWYADDDPARIAFIEDAIPKLRDYMGRFVSIAQWFTDVDRGAGTNYYGLYDATWTAKPSRDTFRGFAERTPAP